MSHLTRCAARVTPRPAAIRRIVTFLVCAAATAGVRADLSFDLENRRPVVGLLSPGSEVETFRITCPAHAVLAVKVASTPVPPAKAGVPVRVRILGVGGVPLPDADSTSTKVSFRGIVVEATGTYTIEITSGDADLTRDVGYALAAAWTSRAKWNVPDLAVAPGNPGLVRFSAPAGSLVRFSAKAPGGVAPAFGRVLENAVATGTDLTGAARKDLRFSAPRTGDFDVEVVTATETTVSATATVSSQKARKASAIDVSNVRGDAVGFRVDGTTPLDIDPAIPAISGFSARVPANTFPVGTSIVVGAAAAVPPAGDFVQAGPAVSITASRKFNSGGAVELRLPFDPAAAEGDAGNLAITIRDDLGGVSETLSGFAADLPSGILTYTTSHLSTYQVSARIVRGTITTVAGNGVGAYAGDGGPATSASLQGPDGVAVDAAGNLFIADQLNRRVRKVDPAGRITTFAGNGAGGYTGDGGPATEASVDNPSGVAVDAAGNVFIVQYDGQRVQKVDAAGRITTVAGTGAGGHSGDGGPATAARLLYPTGVAVDRNGNVYIADYYNHRVRKVDAGGTITTLARC